MNKKKISNKIILFLILLILLIFIGVLASIIKPNQPATTSTDDTLKIYYFDVGQADCSLIISNCEAMLIDGGNEADSYNIINYLKGLGIKNLNYVIATHADDDHIGGLDKIIQAFPTKVVYMPYTNKNSKELTEMKNVAQDIISTPNQNDVFYVGGAKCTIVHIGDARIVSENNSSIVIEVDYGETSCLFMGDSEKEVEKDKEINWNDIDILKVAHHGSNSSSTLEFLETTKPEYAIISADSSKSYEHPHTEVLNNLTTIQATIYRTDQEGTIILNSDGRKYYFTFDKTSLDGNR